MIAQTIELLNTDTYYGQSELIEIAKGKYKLPVNLKEKTEQIKRSKAWQLRNK